MKNNILTRLSPLYLLAIASCSVASEMCKIKPVNMSSGEAGLACSIDYDTQNDLVDRANRDTLENLKKLPQKITVVGENLAEDLNIRIKNSFEEKSPYIYELPINLEPIEENEESIAGIDI